MPIKLHNDLTRREETFAPLEDGRVRFYTCGPTVYNLFHIGNARTFVVFDTMRRYLEYRGYQVHYVQNFTDVEDKVINRARELGITELELADAMIAEYYKDADALGIKRADHHPRVTEHIPEIIDHIQALIDKGFAYVMDGDGVYYRVRANERYGQLSRRSLDDLLAGARVEVDERKEHPGDFALWKLRRGDEIAWDSPWGEGRPGWHIECSVMARKYLGDTLDIHAGGEDLLFPHHENEIAQSEPVTGKPFARYWVHSAFLNFSGEKMSKSMGNIRWAREVVSQFGGEVTRWFLLSKHYRKVLDFTPDLVQAAGKGLERLQNTVRNLRHLEQTAERADLTDTERDIWTELARARERFVEAMDDDMNTALAQSVLHDLATEINTRVGPGSSRALAAQSLALLAELGGVLGVLGAATGGDDDHLAAEIEALIARRQEARKARDFATADSIRDDLKARGIVLEDTPAGVRWRRT